MKGTVCIARLEPTRPGVDTSGNRRCRSQFRPTLLQCSMVVAAIGASLAGCAGESRGFGRTRREWFAREDR
jgi:hypothetical protein